MINEYCFSVECWIIERASQVLKKGSYIKTDLKISYSEEGKNLNRWSWGEGSDFWIHLNLHRMPQKPSIWERESHCYHVVETMILPLKSRHGLGYRLICSSGTLLHDHSVWEIKKEKNIFYAIRICSWKLHSFFRITGSITRSCVEVWISPSRWVTKLKPWLPLSTIS